LFTFVKDAKGYAKIDPKKKPGTGGAKS